MSKVYMKSRRRFASQLRGNSAEVRANMDADGYVSRKYLEGFSKTQGGLSQIPTWITKDNTRTDRKGMLKVGDLLTDPAYDEVTEPASNPA